MGCLWLTLADPDPPVNGQFVYSGGLIRAVANAGMSVSVLGLCQTGSAATRHLEGVIDWQITNDRRRSRLSKLVSPLPLGGLRSRVPEMEAAVTTRLTGGCWEAVIFDSIAGGWALPAVLRHSKRHGCKLVYLSHNHETGVAHSLATTTRGWRRAVRILDFFKVKRLERRLVEAVDLVTANTPEDRQKFAAAAPDKPVLLLPPGYGGPTVDRTIDARLPRRAIVVGTFDWPAKRISLEAFLAAAAPLFAVAAVELQVVGGMEPSYLAHLRNRYPDVEFTGRVPDVRPYLAGARLALVPDVLGGFKLKTLDYVFNRLPIFAMSGSAPGTPLVDGQSIRLFDSHEGLARGVVASIDDLVELDTQQELAYAACADRFDWNVIGCRLVDAIRSLPSRPAGRPSAATEEAADLVRASRGVNQAFSRFRVRLPTAGK
jgi:polysaccharide biosynthesis protein PslH